MSTSNHPETDGKTERTNRVLEDILRGYVHSFSSWNEFLQKVEFAINNSVHASTTHTPFNVNGLPHPRIPALIQDDSGFRGTRLRKNRFGSRLSRIIAHADTFDVDVDNVDIDAVNLSSSDDTAATSDSDDDAGTFSISTIMPARKWKPSLKKRRTSWHCSRSAL